MLQKGNRSAPYKPLLALEKLQKRTKINNNAVKQTREQRNKQIVNQAISRQ